MNLDVDERLLPKGQYPYAQNIRIGNTDGSDIGAAETVRGNRLIGDLGLTNGKCIGAYTDDANRKLYWFITSDDKDLVMEYNESTTTSRVLLESTNPNGVLNFSKDYIITGINKVINDDISNDLLAWTDNRNEPRIINIERVAASYEVDGADSFIEDDISVIKKPPGYEPHTELILNNSLENYMLDKFLSYSYRYKYLDGGYSALSPFTAYQFFPKRYRLNYDTAENDGMVNTFNQVDITFNTGTKRVTDVQLVFRESNKTQVYIIETFNKVDELWDDNSEEMYTFTNSKKFAPLPADELNRLFDNVPRLAKSQELVGNRLNYGNYLEGYNLVDDLGDKVVENYNVDLQSTNIRFDPLLYERFPDSAQATEMIVDFTGLVLSKGLVLNFDINLVRISPGSTGYFGSNMSYPLPVDYANAAELIASAGFINFITVIMSLRFNEVVVDNAPGGTIISTDYVPYEIIPQTGVDFLRIRMPYITYLMDNAANSPPGPATFTTIHRFFIDHINTTVSVSKLGGNRSLKVIGVMRLVRFIWMTTIDPQPLLQVILIQCLYVTGWQIKKTRHLSLLMKTRNLLTGPLNISG